MHDANRRRYDLCGGRHNERRLPRDALSGVGMACRLRMDDPGKTFVVIERRARIGGTWDLFRFPGARSDSDMFTYAYGFRPWQNFEVLADGSTIRDYLDATVREYGIGPQIRRFTPAAPGPQGAVARDARLFPGQARAARRTDPTTASSDSRRGARRRRRRSSGPRARRRDDGPHLGTRFPRFLRIVTHERSSCVLANLVRIPRCRQFLRVTTMWSTAARA